MFVVFLQFVVSFMELLRMVKWESYFSINQIYKLTAVLHRLPIILDSSAYLKSVYFFPYLLKMLSKSPNLGLRVIPVNPRLLEIVTCATAVVRCQ